MAELWGAGCGYLTRIDRAMKGCLCIYDIIVTSAHGPLTRYAKLQVAHAPGMPGTFPPCADFEGNRYLAIPACITARA